MCYLPDFLFVVRRGDIWLTCAQHNDAWAGGGQPASVVDENNSRRVGRKIAIAAACLSVFKRLL
jgi:hypothetical protein